MNDVLQNIWKSQAHSLKAKLDLHAEKLKQESTKLDDDKSDIERAISKDKEKRTPQ